MISDEMLAAAAGEVSGAMVDSISLEDHVFSGQFERKMHALIRRAAHPVRRQVLRYAAAILIAVITAFGALYLFSPTVQAAVNGWIRTTFGSYFHYYSADTTPPDVEFDYALPKAFDGYTLQTTIVQEFGALFLYTNDSGQMLAFDYARGTSNASMFLIDIEDHTYCRDFIHSLCADIYIAPSSDEASIIVWHNPDEKVLFCISAFAGKDELIEFAKKIEKIGKN